MMFGPEKREAQHKYARRHRRDTRDRFRRYALWKRDLLEVKVNRNYCMIEPPYAIRQIVSRYRNHSIVSRGLNRRERRRVREVLRENTAANQEFDDCFHEHMPWMD